MSINIKTAKHRGFMSLTCVNWAKKALIILQNNDVKLDFNQAVPKKMAG